VKDWEEIPDYIRKGLTFHVVDHMEQVIEILLDLKPGDRKVAEKKKRVPIPEVSVSP
jgi:ATP-dependent Lon protease